ncbi:hypothetical protein [Streptomyces sp. NPDC037389]|uniref:hypothetical protein n=1 Tax=Streptomyces sp. NPDC037389 TaxID=3155369 RepID=UPI0033CBE4ED
MAATCVPPTAITTSQCRWTSVFTYGTAFATVSGPSTGRFITFALVAREASSMPAQTGAASLPVTPCSSVSRQALWEVY